MKSEKQKDNNMISVKACLVILASKNYEYAKQLGRKVAGLKKATYVDLELISTASSKCFQEFERLKNKSFENEINTSNTTALIDYIIESLKCEKSVICSIEIDDKGMYKIPKSRFEELAPGTKVININFNDNIIEKNRKRKQIKSNDILEKIYERSMDELAEKQTMIEDSIDVQFFEFEEFIKCNSDIQTGKLILVAGFPGSGKSTIGKRIAKDLNYTYIDKDTIGRPSTDEIIRIQGSYEGDRDTNAYSDVARRTEYEDMGRLAAANLEIGNNVVLSAPFTSQAECFMKDVNIEELYLGSVGDSLKGFIIWVKTQRVIERERLYDRDAERDIWKLSHWQHHCNVNETKENSYFPEGYKNKSDHYASTNLSRLIIFENDFDDDLEDNLKELYLKMKKHGGFHIKIHNDFIDGIEDKKNIRDKEIAQNMNMQYLGNIYEFDNLITKDCPDPISEIRRPKILINANLKTRNFAKAIVVKNIIFESKVDFESIATGYEQLYFEECTFEQGVSFKKNNVHISFSHCEFHQRVVFFNSGIKDERNLLFFRCDFKDSCLIEKYKCKTISLQDCVFEELYLRDVCYSNIDFYFNIAKIVDVKSDCKGDQQAQMHIISSTFETYLKLPPIPYVNLHILDCQIEKIQMSESTIENINERYFKREIIKKNRSEYINYSMYTRYIDTLLVLYSTFCYQNKYKEADNCLLLLRYVRCKGNWKKPDERLLPRLWYTLNYWFINVMWGGGIKFTNLFGLMILTNIVISIGFIIVFFIAGQDIFDVAPKVIYWDISSFLNLGNNASNIMKSLFQTDWLRNAVNIFSVVLGIYGVLFIAVLTGAIIRKLIR